MAISKQKTVWVLGAGFSQPLGGPLLPALLSRTSYELLRLRFPQEPLLLKEASLMAVRLYHYGRGWPEGPIVQRHNGRGEKLWEHAEDYLAKLDAAGRARNSPMAQYLTRIAKALAKDTGDGATPPLRDVAAAARRLVGAE